MEEDTKSLIAAGKCWKLRIWNNLVKYFFAELYFLIAKFLSKSPLQTTANVIIISLCFLQGIWKYRIAFVYVICEIIGILITKS